MASTITLAKTMTQDNTMLLCSMCMKHCSMLIIVNVHKTLFNAQCSMLKFFNPLVGGGWWVRRGFSFVEFLKLIMFNVHLTTFNVQIVQPASGWRLVGKKGRKNSSPVSLPRYQRWIDGRCISTCHHHHHHHHHHHERQR